MLLGRFLAQFIKEGRLEVIDADGISHVFQGADGPDVTIRLHDRKLHRTLFFNPKLAIGEAYMDGTLTVERGDLYEFIKLCSINLMIEPRAGVMRWLDRVSYVLRRFQQLNPHKAARRNVAHHYDLSGELYDLFLDADRQYSCAYFAEPDMSLEEAQRQKKLLIARKLMLEPGQKILDIGCGWGGMALTLAQCADVEVLGVTLSEEQLKRARARAAAAGLADRVRFELMDYRDVEGTFDRIVSVGMFEHVGVPNYGRFFEKTKSLLTSDGVALIHAIGRREGPGSTNPWLRKYIFPGGYSPALSEVVAAVEPTGLWVTDIEILRLHYARTLAEWRRRFDANRDKIAKLYDERFCRMWEFYLIGCELSFSHQDMMIWQMQLSPKVDVVPLTRDYLARPFEPSDARADRVPANAARSRVMAG